MRTPTKSKKLDLAALDLTPLTETEQQTINGGHGPGGSIVRAVSEAMFSADAYRDIRR